MIQVIQGQPFPCRDCKKPITLKNDIPFDAMPTGNGEYIFGKPHNETCPVKLMKMAMKHCLFCFVEGGENIIHAERHFSGHDLMPCQKHKSSGRFKYESKYYETTLESLQALLKEARHRVNVEKKRGKVADGNFHLEGFV